MSYMLGLDIGTSGVKALLVKEEGDIVGSASQEYPMHSPRPGWAEQDPEDMWQGTVKAIRQLLKSFAIRPEEIKGIGLSGQMHSAIFLDENLQVIRPAILWNDTRTSKQCRDMERIVGEELLHEEACNPALEGFTAPKILWLRENEPENFRRLYRVVLPKDYIRYRLTGQLNMELSDAAGTLLLNVRRREWSTKIMSKLDLPMSILPPLVGSSEVVGTVSSEAAQVTGLSSQSQVVGGGADNACGAVGAGIVKEGRSMLSLGTSGVMLAYLDEPRLSSAGTIHMFNHAVAERFYMMGVILSAGLSYRWFRDELGRMEMTVGQRIGQDAYVLLGQQAAVSPVGSRGLIFLPYLTGERTPHGDANARGVYFGISASTTRADMIRAILEGVAYAFSDILDLLRGVGWQGNSVRAIGGGAKSQLWREIIASVLGLQVETLNSDEGPALGAALLAGVGTGIFNSTAEASDALLRVTSVVEPNREWARRYQELAQIYKQLYPALKPSYDRLAQLDLE